MLRKGTVLLRLMDQSVRGRVEATGPLTQNVGGGGSLCNQNWQLDEKRCQLVKKQLEIVEKPRKVYKKTVEMIKNPYIVR